MRPRLRAASSPSKVRLDINACSNSEIAPRIWKNIRPTAVEESTPWSRTTRSIWRCWRMRAGSLRCPRERPSRSSLVTTSWSPARVTSSAWSSSGRRPELAGGLLDKHRLAAGRDQGVVLGFGVLVAGGDPGVADPHCRTAAQTPERVTQARTRVALHVCPAETQNRHGCLVERSSADAAQHRLALREPEGISPLVTRSLTAPRVARPGQLDRR